MNVIAVLQAIVPRRVRYALLTYFKYHIQLVILSVRFVKILLNKSIIVEVMQMKPLQQQSKLSLGPISLLKLLVVCAKKFGL